MRSVRGGAFHAQHAWQSVSCAACVAERFMRSVLALAVARVRGGGAACTRGPLRSSMLLHSGWIRAEALKHPTTGLQQQQQQSSSSSRAAAAACHNGRAHYP